MAGTRQRGGIASVLRRYVPAGAVALMVCLVAGAGPVHTVAAKKKPASKGPTPAAAANSAVGAEINALSMCVSAMAAIYDMDLSDSQLASIRELAAGTADTRQRTKHSGAIKVQALLTDLRVALPNKDEAHIDELRAAVTEMVDDGTVELDDQPAITDVARLKAPRIMKLITAGQVSSYMSERTDEIDDPAEWLLETVDEIRDYDAKDTTEAIQYTAGEVSRLAAGLDAGKEKRVYDQIAAWLIAHKQLTAAQFATQHDALKESAKRVVGDTPAMQVLTNWMSSQMAKLLSNPMLTTAIDETRAARSQTKP